MTTYTNTIAVLGTPEDLIEFHELVLNSSGEYLTRRGMNYDITVKYQMIHSGFLLNWESEGEPGDQIVFEVASDFEKMEVTLVHTPAGHEPFTKPIQKVMLTQLLFKYGRYNREQQISLLDWQKYFTKGFTATKTKEEV